jgi:hypothetical protein
LWGPSFLVLERSNDTLYEIFFSNASGRREAKHLKPFLPTAANESVPSAATISIRYKPSPRFGGWHVPVVSKCSEPFGDTKVTNEKIAAEVDKFRNPEVAETASEDEAQSQDRAR